MEILKEDRPRCFSISLPHRQPSKKKGKDASQSLPHGQARERRVRDGSQSLPHPFTTSSQYMDDLTSYVLVRLTRTYMPLTTPSTTAQIGSSTPFLKALRSAPCHLARLERSQAACSKWIKKW
ncbi:hypothetical protein SAY86_019847 [Trapa natans]|uniref:Uncharacterized protein n=1 Tax=Trapa natans TaxID=22666 RepID=A0AAN7LYB0_TRANT|nr:hypothetical protein SAY86_019847 [Trapa natans]